MFVDGPYGTPGFPNTFTEIFSLRKYSEKEKSEYLDHWTNFRGLSEYLTYQTSTIMHHYDALEIQLQVNYNYYTSNNWRESRRNRGRNL